ncbi:aminopeptidase [Elongatibacter sediminis]|uniref:Aminopeptidase n=1 Tax=Elongatibacter sediminis TaxID=3119006 RepID=A0AAW9RJP6_9GAMM
MTRLPATGSSRERTRGRDSRRRSVRAGTAILLALTVFALLPAGGCAGPGYYAQAITGHLRLMHARQDAGELIADAATDPALAASLREARAILEFGRDNLGLPNSDSYRQVVITGRDAVTWNVVAAPEFSTVPRRWCFPVAGCVPYRGYFARDKAEDFASRRAAHGEDVAVSPATAYSTLGWFDDPLLDTMLRYGDAELAALLFHELAHEKLYVGGDTAFNEAYATFVAAAGVRRWAAATGRTALARQWDARRLAMRDFNHLLAQTRDELDELYASGLPEPDLRDRKKAVFERMRSRYAGLVESSWGGADYFGGWMATSLNNAHLALMDQYQGGDCAFATLFKQAGADFERFHALASDRAKLPEAERAKWLKTGCDGFASGTDL